MKYNTQLDSRWKNDSMGIPGDLIGRWGCLVSCIANIMQECTQKEITPKEVNNRLKENKGYKGSGFINQESFIDWTIASKIFGFQTFRYSGRLFNEDFKPEFYFIARIIHPKTGSGHYINLIKAAGLFYLCFDVETGELKLIPYKEVTDILKITVQC